MPPQIFDFGRHLPAGPLTVRKFLAALNPAIPIITNHHLGNKASSSYKGESLAPHLPDQVLMTPHLLRILHNLLLDTLDSRLKATHLSSPLPLGVDNLLPPALESQARNALVSLKGLVVLSEPPIHREDVVEWALSSLFRWLTGHAIPFLYTLLRSVGYEEGQLPQAMRYRGQLIVNAHNIPDGGLFFLEADGADGLALLLAEYKRGSASYKARWSIFKEVVRLFYNKSGWLRVSEEGEKVGGKILMKNVFALLWKLEAAAAEKKAPFILHCSGEEFFLGYRMKSKKGKVRTVYSEIETLHTSPFPLLSVVLAACLVSAAEVEHAVKVGLRQKP